MRSSRSHAALGALALLFSLALSQGALAGPPAHHPDEARDIAGFDHACGIAVDSEGDVYVSSAGESKVRIFDPDHVEFASAAISNSNEPCALAVNSKGELFVSEKATKKVVRYKPTVPYPFSGPPTYGPSEPIDSSGNAKGIAVDRFDDRLYVAKGERIAVYKPDGTPESASNEVQSVRVIESTGGTYTLTFRGQTTVELPFNAPCTDAGTPGVVDSVEEALEGLTTIGPGNTLVTPQASSDVVRCIVTFEGTLHNTTVPQLRGNGKKLTGGAFGLFINTETQGFSGHIEGGLAGATGVAAYTYVSDPPGAVRADRYVFAADDGPTDRITVFSGPDIKEIEPRRTIEGLDHDRNPATPDQKLDFGEEGAYLAADAGYCPKEGDDPEPGQACTAGHFLVYDEGHEAVDEFDASGEFVTQIPSGEPPFEDAQPTAIAIDRSGGSSDGTSYVTSGAASNAKALAFSPLKRPSREPLNAPPKDLTFKLPNACGMEIDSAGNRYVAADTTIAVYPPEGEIPPTEPLTTIENPARPCDIAVDSECNLYAIVAGSNEMGDEKAVLYTPKAKACPEAGAKYEGPITVATPADFPVKGELRSIGVNPKNDHVFVSQVEGTIELDSVKGGSEVLDRCFASSSSGVCSGGGQVRDIDAYAKNGNVYVSRGANILVYDERGQEVLARISGVGSPKHIFNFMSIAVDQANGHVIAFESERKVAEEYEASGTFVAQFGSFKAVPGQPKIAVDNSGGPNDGNVYIASFEDLDSIAAFSPLSYADRPKVATGSASDVGEGEATLNGTVDPRGFAVEDCSFQYTTDADFKENGFSGASSEPCVPDPSGIGSGNEPVVVHADLSGLDPEGRYRFRLVAGNEHGSEAGLPRRFGPPEVTPEPAKPVAYTEASLRATIDPFGLVTEYRFEYGTDEDYGQSTATVELQPDAGPTEVEVPIFGLKEGTEYHFRILAENEAKVVPGADQTLKTRIRPSARPCPNEEFRGGLSANLPDCRAYELVTPADMRGVRPYQTSAHQVSDWLVVPHGEGAGERLTFFTTGTLPGFEGSGLVDGYRAERGEGAHPKEWASQFVGASYAQASQNSVVPRGVAPDQLYSVWEFGSLDGNEGPFTRGPYLRTPDDAAESECPESQGHFEPVGCGSLGTDPDSEVRFVGVGGTHIVFFSEKRLEEEAPPNGTKTIYDRAAGASSAQVVSLPPAGASTATKEEFEELDASYIASTEDGSAVAFDVGGALYLRRDNAETVKVADASNTFAGLSEDGERAFYTDASDGEDPGQLSAFVVDSETPIPIAANSVFVNVSADGSHAFFTSEAALTEPGEENENGEHAEASKHNLYVWDGVETRFIAILDPADVVGGIGGKRDLLRWSDAIAAPLGPDENFGRGLSPTRSTPDGGVFVFESHAQLTPYDNTEASPGTCGAPEAAGDRCAQIYRYDAAEDSLLCVSCEPGGVTPPSGDATLQDISSFDSPVVAQTLIPNVTDDGRAVFFGSKDPLLPDDANSVRDVYQWKAFGEGEAGDCDLPGGCLALISSGQGEDPSFLYSMTPDGHDVFFSTLEKLHGKDVVGSSSIYDARIDGGIPDPPAPEPCQGDGCQGQGSTPPTLPAPTSTGSGDGNVKEPGSRPRRCPKGKRKLRSKGKVRCVKKRRAAR